MQIPRYLQIGDPVGIVAPARKVSMEEIQAGIDWIIRQGWVPVYTDRLFGSCNQYSGTDQERRDDLQEMLDNPEIRAIFCARGGYGGIRIIDALNFEAFCKDPKWLVGFSDATVLLAHIQKNFGIAGIHGPMLFGFADQQISEEGLICLHQALTGKSYEIHYDSQYPVRDGIAEGIVCGGNLSILYALSGSSSDPDFTDKILFIEDIDEYLYHIDRMMIQLKRAGKLAKLAGLVVGGMTAMRDNTIPFGKPACDIIHEHVSEYDYPVAMGFPAGHIRDNRSLIIGIPARLEVGRQTRLHYSL